jgi:hypothetical protein
MFARDTDLEAERVRLRVLGGMSFEQRLALLDDAIQMGRELALAGLRARFPGADDGVIRREYFRLVLGKDLADRVLAVGHH